MEGNRDRRRSFLSMLHDLGVQEPAVFLFRKVLLKSDVDRSQSRLQLKRDVVENSHLPRRVPSLRANMARAGDDPQRRPPPYTARATMVNSQGEAIAVDFKYVRSSNSYRVMGGWNRLARGCGMAEGQLVDMWWFDVTQLPGGADEGGRLPEIGLAILNHPWPGLEMDSEEPGRLNGEQPEDEAMQQHDQADEQGINIVEQAEEEADEQRQVVGLEEKLMMRRLDVETRRLVESLWRLRNCRPKREDIKLGKATNENN